MLLLDLRRYVGWQRAATDDRRSQGRAPSRYSLPVSSQRYCMRPSTIRNRLDGRATRPGGQVGTPCGAARTSSREGRCRGPAYGRWRGGRGWRRWTWTFSRGARHADRRHPRPRPCDVAAAIGRGSARVPGCGRCAERTRAFRFRSLRPRNVRPVAGVWRTRPRPPDRTRASPLFAMAQPRAERPAPDPDRDARRRAQVIGGLFGALATGKATAASRRRTNPIPAPTGPERPAPRSPGCGPGRDAKET